MRFLPRPLIALLLIPSLVPAADRLSVPWSSLDQWADKQFRLRLTLQDQTRVESRLVRVEDQTLVCAILKSSNPRMRGEVSIPRRDIQKFEVRRETRAARKRGFLVGGTCGGLLGLLGAAMADRPRDANGQRQSGAAAAAGSLGVGIGMFGAIGWAIGSAIDSQFTEIEIR
jgi:hypothetical protein